VRLPDMPGRDLRGDPRRAGRRRRCGAANGEQDIIIHWRGRDQANLAEIKPGIWAGPCLRCGRFRVLRVKVGDNGDVIWTVTGGCGHTREDVYPALVARVPCAPNPSAGPHGHNLALDALKDTMMALALNKVLTPVALRLAMLEATGIQTDEALDVLGITDTGNRRRTRLARDKALSPGLTVKTDSKPRPKASGSEHTPARETPPSLPAKTRLPVTTVKTDSGQAVSFDSQPSTAKPPLNSTFLDLTGRATVVSGPAGTDTTTGTELDLELMRTGLGGEVIATEPRTSPFPVADATEVWTLADEGPCTRCETRTCRYGNQGSPLCADCRATLTVNPSQPTTLRECA